MARSPGSGRLGLLTALGCALPLLASADPLVLAVDPARSSVAFELGATLHTVEGRAAIRPGARIRFDPDTGQTSGRVVMEATSVDTGSKRRDRGLHGQVLESARYPEIAFEAKSLEILQRGESQASFLLRGELAIHGGRHRIELEGRATGSAPGALEATAEVVLPYVEWGMRDMSNFLLSVEPEVLVRVTVSGAVSRDPRAAQPDS